MSPAVRNMLGRERASSCSARGVLGARAVGPVGTAAWRAPVSAEAGWRWLQLPGTSRVLGADRGGKKVVLTCKQSRLRRKLIGGNFIWNAEALFLERLFFLLTTL